MDPESQPRRPLMEKEEAQQEEEEEKKENKHRFSIKL